MSGWVRLVRPGNLAMGLLGVVVGALVAGGQVWALRVAVAGVVAVLGMAGGNALNDVVDREVDRSLGRARPVARGDVGVRAARVFVLVAMAAALGLALWVGPQAAWVAAGSVLALMGYEAWGKARGLVGNVLVSLPVGALFLLGAAATGDLWDGVVWAVAATAVLANTAREVLKDVEDEEADAGHRRTLVMRIGVKPTWIVAGVFLGGAVLASVAPFALGLLDPWRWVVLAPTGILFAGVLLTPSPRSAQMRVKVGMAWALFGFGAIVLL